MLRNLLVTSIAVFAVVFLGQIRFAAAQSFPGVPGHATPPGIGAQFPIGGHPGVGGQPVIVGGGPNGTSVQLPTFSFFTISTTVLVPDSGTAFMGGVNGGTGAGRQNGAPGLPGSRAGGSSVNAGGMTITAQIHDLREMDRALLDGRRELTAAEQATNVWHARLDRAKQSSAGRPAISMAEARAAASQ
jgi:hypothetical protein